MANVLGVAFAVISCQSDNLGYPPQSFATVSKPSVETNKRRTHKEYTLQSGKEP
jgi:hypothetical protein